MDVGDPPAFSSPFLVWRRLADVIVQRSDLAAQDALIDDRTQPSPLKHGTFRLRPGDLVEVGKARPGAPATVRENVEVVLTHEYEPGAHEASWGRASHAFVQVYEAVLSGTRLSGIHQPKFIGRRAPILRGTVIEQSVLFSVQYHLDIPTAS